MFYLNSNKEDQLERNAVKLGYNELNGTWKKFS